MQFIANKLLRRLAGNARGVAMVEFAVALPVLLTMFVGGYVMSDMIHCNRKVTVATRALTDMVARNMSPTGIYSSPSTYSGTSYLSASAVVVSPFKLNNATEQISLLRVCDATHAYVVWTKAQTQNASGSTVTATTSTLTAGTLPASATQSSSTVVTIPSNMVNSTMIPTSPDGSNVCSNLDPNVANKTQVGTAGGWLFMGQIKYVYTPLFSFGLVSTTNLVDSFYMTPRLQ